MDYVVKFTSEGLLSGAAVGEKVEIADSHDAQHLIGLGIIGPVQAERPAASKPADKGGAGDAKPSKPAASKPADK